MHRNQYHYLRQHGNEDLPETFGHDVVNMIQQGFIIQDFPVLRQVFSGVDDSEQFFHETKPSGLEDGTKCSCVSEGQVLGLSHQAERKRRPSPRPLSGVSRLRGNCANADAFDVWLAVLWLHTETSSLHACHEQLRDAERKINLWLRALHRGCRSFPGNRRRLQIRLDCLTLADLLP